MKNLLKNSLSILLILFLTSCGGGGGSGKTETTINEPPISEQENIYDFDIDASAKPITRPELNGGNTIAYKFEVINYPDIENLEGTVYIDGNYIRKFETLYPFNVSLIDEAREMVTINFPCKVKPKKIRIILEIKDSREFISDKTFDISNVEVIAPPPISGKK